MFENTIFDLTKKNQSKENMNDLKVSPEVAPEVSPEVAPEVSPEERTKKIKAILEVITGKIEKDILSFGEGFKCLRTLNGGYFFLVPEKKSGYQLDEAKRKDSGKINKFLHDKK